jgi:hypothetical protein
MLMVILLVVCAVFSYLASMLSFLEDKKFVSLIWFLGGTMWIVNIIIGHYRGWF